MDYRSYREAFDEAGFVVLTNFLPADAYAELRSELDRYIRDIVPDLPHSEAFYQDRSRPETLRQLQRMGRDPFFDAYRRHPCWLALAEALLGEPAEADQPEWFNKLPGTAHATPPHQDNHYFQLVPPQVLTMWLALDAVDEENGALRYVRGSHLAGRRPHAATDVVGFSQGVTDYGPCDEAAECLVTLSPGDLVVHHGETIHRADSNRSPDRQRRAFAMVFRGASCRVDDAARAEYQTAVQAQHEKVGLVTNSK